MAGIVAVLLAAGESSRMGQPKALLPWQGVPLVQYQVESLLQAGASPVIVVVGHQREMVEPHIPPIATVVVNPRYQEGRASSVKAGLAAVPDDCDAVTFLGVDQPRSPTLLAQLFEAHRQSKALLTRPTYAGHHGHSVVFAASLLPELRRVREETQGLRAVVRRHAAHLLDLPVDSPEALLDLNQPEDYQRALAAKGQ